MRPLLVWTMSTVICMPIRFTDHHRARAWEYVTDRLIHDGWPTLSTGHQIDPWCKADAVQVAREEAMRWHRGDPVLVVHDADAVIDLADLRAAVEAVESGDVEWAIPHHLVKRLSEEATEMAYEGMPLTAPDLVRQPYVGLEGGGCTVLRASTYDDCPLDRRFLGWGEEDQSWGWALRALHGVPWRGTSDLWHLWHPSSVESRNGRSTRMASNQLRRAYRAYRDEPANMRALIDGAR